MLYIHIRQPLLQQGSLVRGEITSSTCSFRKQRWSFRTVPGPFHPSGPGCLAPASNSFDRSCAGQKPAARRRKQGGSWQCRKTSKMNA